VAKKSVKTKITKIKKRSGKIVTFSSAKIERAIKGAFKAAGGVDVKRIRFLTEKVVREIEIRFNSTIIPEVEQVQDIIETILIRYNHEDVYRAFNLYRGLHHKLRNITSLVDSDELIEKYVEKNDWRVKENANMTYSLQGLNNHVASIVSSNFWLNKIYPRDVRKAHVSGDIHIHDLALISAYCTGWDLKEFLTKGFGGVSGKVHSKPPKHLRTALGQLVNFYYTIQGEVAGAVAVANFDTYLAPFIRFDKLTYKEVKQALQEFIFNMNVPTRVGFQCLSEDTEILTKRGWKGYSEVKKGEMIRTFNVSNGQLEEKKVKSVFKKEYQGTMYWLTNRIQDQLVSPKHRIVRKKFNSKSWIIEPIEEVYKLKSPVIIPVSGENKSKDINLTDQQIKLMAWIIGEGSLEKPGNGYRSCYRVSIYQSKIVNLKNYQEIIDLLKYFKLNYSEYTQTGLGQPVQRLRLDARSSRLIHSWFSKQSIKFAPDILLNMSKRQSRLFLQSYIKADGYGGNKISCSDVEIINSLQMIAVNAGWGSTVLVRKPTVGSKNIFVLRLIKHQDTYIDKIREVDYSGVIWCPNTENETVIARRKGKVFITGNTPFTNISMDLKPTKMVGNETVIIGGEPINAKYKDYQKEMDMINKAFAEVMMDGDAQGRVFTFPIPTYSITKDFDWNNKDYEPIWEMARKYGIPYFSNFINSDMDPDDARSMCCRLRLDNKVLRKRGGLFSANPLTGSLGVVTINLPRIGYKAKENSKSEGLAKRRFITILGELMDLAKESLVIKREMVEKYTKIGLYPYCRYYLEGIYEKNGVYWKNHFNTIGINGMNEALINLFGKNITDPEAKEFALEAMDYMREKILIFQRETGEMFNLEATPAEGTAFRFARIDKAKYPKIICANENLYKSKNVAPFYTNSTHLPVDYTSDVFEALDHQDELQCKYNGGTVLHGFLGESLSDTKSVKKLVRKVAENYKLPYFSVTPTFSVCPIHGYLAGKWEYCPKCDEEIGFKKKKKAQKIREKTKKKGGGK